ncbi:MAG: peptidyl-tRNA hydrolase Pth2 [Thaumarchaeota archaeon]|nr:peptidyl-tRNA hydrolase Pth2 [Nitrososphaerota archaeon]
MDVKQVVIVRMDLNMSKGKIASQVGHACVIGAENVRKIHPNWFNDWWSNQKKIVLRAKNQEELNNIQIKALKSNLPCSRIIDAGKTQIDPNTTTCLVIGPAPEDAINIITSKLKLL